MDDDARIMLPIPDPQGFDEEHSTYIPVPSAVIDYTIDLLQCFVAQYRADEGVAPDDRAWDALAAAAGHAAAGLRNAQMAYYHQGGVRELVEQIDQFCDWRDSHSPYDTVGRNRTGALATFCARPHTAAIVDALAALREARQRQRKER
jgi:hypothetical protein